MAEATFKPERSTLGLPITLSLLFHLLLFSTVPSFLNGAPSARTNSPGAEKIMRVRFNQLKDTAGQLVDIMDMKPSEEKVPENAQYLSDKNRTVDHETQSRFTGPHPTSSIGRPGSQEQSSKGSLPTRGKGAGQYDLSLPEIFLNQSPPGAGGQTAALAPSNYLPQIAMGDETLLNTKEYAFASFYIRMKRQMEATWSPRSVLNQSRIAKDQYITIVGITLNKDGSLDDVKIVQTSGNTPLDNEAINAIQRAAPYLNPPKELLENDGRIHIPLWNFIVTMNALF